MSSPVVRVRLESLTHGKGHFLLILLNQSVVNQCLLVYPLAAWQSVLRRKRLRNVPMPLTLDQYADFLDTRDLVWPAPPTATPSNAKPYLKPREGIRVVTWTIYGTLLNI